MRAVDTISDALREKISHQAPGDKLPSVRSLMRRYGTSLHSINLALRKLEAEGLVEVKKGSGIYISARRGVRYIELHRPQYPSLAMDIKEASIEKAVAKEGWKLLVKAHPLTGDTLDEQLNPKACAHVIMTSVFESNPNFYTQLTAQPAPGVALGRVGDIFMMDSVMGDDHNYMSLLVKHLRELGHTRLAFLSNEPVAFTPMQRSEIFTSIAELFDLPNPIVIECDTKRGESSFFKAYEGMRRYLEKVDHKPSFTAMITETPSGIISSLRALHESGLVVPRDCSLASFAIEPENSLLIPSITEAGVSEDSWGIGVVEVLKRRFATPDAPPTCLKLKPTLIARESTAAI